MRRVGPQRAALTEDEVIRVSARLVCGDHEFANERPLDKTRVYLTRLGCANIAAIS